MTRLANTLRNAGFDVDAGQHHVLVTLTNRTVCRMEVENLLDKYLLPMPLNCYQTEIGVLVAENL